MKRTFLLKKLPLLVLVSGLVLTVTFAQNSSGSNKSSGNDTLPKKLKQVRDLDEALLELDKGEAEMQRALKEVDMAKIERQIRESMKNLDVDMAKMKAELERAMKNFDAQKINADVQKGLAEMQKSLKEVDAEKMKQEIAASIAKIDTEKMKAELEKVKEIDMSKLKKELEEIRPEIEKSMREAKADIEKARKEIASYKGLVSALENDGLVKKDGNYKIEYSNGELTVNGKKLSAAETKKYSEYLSGKDRFTLEKNEDGLDVHK